MLLELFSEELTLFFVCVTWWMYEVSSPQVHTLFLAEEPHSSWLYQTLYFKNYVIQCIIIWWNVLL